MENMSRRKFLKLGALSAGLVTLAGCASVKKTPIGGGEFDALLTKPKLVNGGWFIDMSKVDNLDEISQLCHKEHNVPNVPDKRHEVKWVWAEPFICTFQRHYPHRRKRKIC